MVWRAAVTTGTFPYDSAPIRYLADNGVEVVDRGFHEKGDLALSESEIITALDDVDGVIAGGAWLTRSVLKALPRLKVISRRGIGFNRVDVEAATESGIVVTTTPGTLEPSVADYTMALILAISRGIVPGHDRVVSGGWSGFLGDEFTGKTLGIVGLGHIGRMVAARAAGFQLTIVAYDPIQDQKAAARLGVTYVELDELLARSDFVTLHCNPNPTNVGLINADRLRLMKPSAYLINTSRGSVIDEEALRDALQRRAIRGAAIDVLAKEPPTANPLIGLDNILVTPHSAGSTVEANDRASMMAAQNLLGVLTGKLVDPALVVRNIPAWEARLRGLAS
jgi:D-3-phosphoglycerate dehydrogenase / 2-oxoglutarate reductase